MSKLWVAYAMGIASVLLPIAFGLLMFWIDDPEPRDQYGWRLSMDEQGGPLDG